MGDGHPHDHPYGAALLTAPEPAPGRDRRRAVLGLDTGATELRSADALLQSLAGLPTDVLACTHPIRGEHPHVAMTVEVPAEDAAAVWAVLRAAADAVPGGGAAWGYRRHGAAPAAEAAGAAAAAHLLGRGRAVRYPGAEALTGTVTVAELLARSAVDRVTVVGGGTAEGGSPVATDGGLRPERRAGQLVLVLAPTADGRLAQERLAGP